MIQVKLHFEQIKEIRRFNLKKDYEELKKRSLEVLSKHYGLIDSLLFMYIDQDGDWVHFTSSEEFLQAIQFYNKEKSNVMNIRVFASGSAGKPHLINQIPAKIEEIIKEVRDYQIGEKVGGFVKEVPKKVKDNMELIKEWSEQKVVEAKSWGEFNMEKAKKEIPKKVEEWKKKIPPQVQELKKEIPKKVEDFKKEIPKKVEEFKKEIPKKMEQIKTEWPKKVEEISKKIPEHFEEFKKEVKGFGEDVKKILEIEKEKVVEIIPVKKEEKIVEITKVEPKKSEEKIVEITEVKEDKKEKPKVVPHKGVLCNNCKCCPIIGLRYKCLTKRDFDLCEKCFKIRHEFKMENASFDVFSAPGKVIQTFIPSDQDEITYRNSLKLLAQMGFGEKEVCLKTLKKNKGDMSKTVNELIQK